MLEIKQAISSNNHLITIIYLISILSDDLSLSVQQNVGHLVVGESTFQVQHVLLLVLGDSVVIELVPELSTLMCPGEVMPTVSTQPLMGDHSYQVVLSSVQSQPMISVDFIVVLFQVLSFCDGLELLEELSLLKIG